MVVIGRSLLIFSDVTFKMAAWWPYWIFLFPDSIFRLALNINFKLQRHNTYVFRLEPIDFQQRHFQNGRLVAILNFSVSGLCRWHGFRSISQVCFGISISNFICMLVLVIGNSLLIFNDVTFKMAAWWPYWIFWFPDSNFSLALNINSKHQWQKYLYIWVIAYIDFQWPHFLNGCLVPILDFSVSGWHGFSSLTQICFGISVSNFLCMSLVAVGRSL